MPMLFAMIMMLFLGISASLMSLGAIDFGLIVDSSVIMVENCVRRLSSKPDGKSPLATIRDACMEVRGPTMFGVLIIAVVYVPVLLLEGTENKMLRPMALTVRSCNVPWRPSDRRSDHEHPVDVRRVPGNLSLVCAARGW